LKKHGHPKKGGITLQDTSNKEEANSQGARGASIGGSQGGNEIDYRHEKCVFKMTFDKNKFDEFKNLIERFTDIKPIEKGDTLEVTYNVNVDYIGVVGRLQAILEIARKYGKDVIDISTEELNYGECLIQEVFLIFQKIRENLYGK